MEEDKDKDLDIFLKKTIKEINLEEPSSNFTADIFSKIRPLRTKDTLVHKPLISEWVWWFIGLLISGISFFLIIDDSYVQESWFHLSKLDFLNQLNVFNGVNLISDTVIYGLLALTIFIYIQVFILKRYFFNRYQLK